MRGGVVKNGGSLFLTLKTLTLNPLKIDPGNHFSTGSLFNVTPAKMEYYYSGTESLWCWNWNHLACRRWKCEVDHPCQSTEVNLGKKQKWCSLWCPWSQVQQDISGPDNFRILDCLWTIHHRCTCKWDWTEILTVSFPLRAKTYEIRFVWIQKDVGEKRGTIRTHWKADCLLEDFSGKNHGNIVN